MITSVAEYLLVTSLRMIVRRINGIITVAFFPFLYRLYRQSKKKFYILWAIGFLLYGINVIIRAEVDLSSTLDPNSLDWVAFLFYMTGFIFIIVGIGDLLERIRVAMLSTVLLVLVPYIAYNVTNPATLGWITSLSPFAIITISLYFIWRKYADFLDMFVVGWLFLFLVNISIPLKMMNIIYVDFLAIVGKVIIFRGMIGPRFPFLADNMKRFLISGSPIKYPEEGTEHCILVSNSTNSGETDIEWINNKISENVKQGVRTILVTLYDLVTIPDLKEVGSDINDFYLIRMLPEENRGVQEYGENIAIIDDNPVKLRILISEILNFSAERKIRCDIIIYTLSWAIKTQGIDRIYNSIASQIPELKESDVRLYCFFEPSSHDTEENRRVNMIADNQIIL